jgi:hypothetical protein
MSGNELIEIRQVHEPADFGPEIEAKEKELLGKLKKK